MIDPDRTVHKLLRRDLAGQGYNLLMASNAQQALGLLHMEPDLALVEINLPDGSGLDLIGRLRERGEGLPIIAFSASADTDTKVQAFELGASDFLMKPFEVKELAARIRVNFRRQFEYRVERPVYRLDQLEVDLRRRIVKFRDADVMLSPKEYDLLRLLVLHAGKVLTHQFLMGELWEDKVDTQFLRVYIRQLRNKIEQDPANPQLLLTQLGVGYRLKPSDEAHIGKR
ncbi:response regulator transcription factor [Hyphomicrobium sp. B1]|uniref:response regulator transcription factor n=1 Tax=Hyphomicrobium sp. B1 TaxID=3075651 RepID=UPI003C2F84FF